MSLTLHTTHGNIKIQLFCQLCPKTCKNFLALSASGKYDNTIFHRNIKGFIIQGGDPTGTGKQGQSIYGKVFEDEFVQNLKHDRRGILSMANSGPNTNGSQFFITYGRVSKLNKQYTVFGKVIDGFEALDLMQRQPVDDKDSQNNNACEPNSLKLTNMNNGIQSIQLFLYYIVLRMRMINLTVYITLSVVLINSIIINLMAFVFRGQKIQSSKPNPIVGPGSYNFEVQRQNKIPKAYVPFNSMEPKTKQNNNTATALVGPGSYNIDIQHSGQKIIVSSQTQDIKILQISRPHPVFKSGVNRFSQIKQQLVTPGPGQYNIKGIQVRPKVFSTNTTSKPKILQHLININQYQSIPSIPSNLHAFGYNQNQNNQLQLNEPPIQYFKGEKEDKVGPGQYNPNVNQVKSRGVSWSQSKSKKEQQIKTNLHVGPGTYQTTTINPLYNYKPSSNFASKTVRTMDQRKGAIINTQKIVQQKNSSQTQSRVYSQKAPPSTQLDSDEDSQYQYIEDTTPGPGSYLQISQVSRTKAGKTATSFGASKRFNDGKSQMAKPKNVGPGSYNVGFNFGKKLKYNKQIKPKPDQLRCPSIINNNVVVPGPGSYQPRNTMQDKLIYKIQRGYRGQFGSTQARSKQAEQDEKPGPASYNPVLLNNEKQVTAAFKSKNQRKFIEQKRNQPPVGSYNLIYTDIATKIIKQQQQDPDLIIKKPGFGVGQQRFKQMVKQQEDYEDDDIIKQIQQKHRQERKLKMLKNNSVFKSKQPRFKENKLLNPGPGSYYDGEEDYWNKRTYNILFADI